MAKADQAEWAKRIERWRDSGLSAKEFAAETGLKPSTLSYWKWRLKSEGKAAPRSTSLAKRTSRKQPQGQGLSFVEVAGGAIAMSSRFEVELAPGVVLRVPMDFDSEALGAVVEHYVGADPRSGALFVFINKRKNRLKVLWFDRNGFCILYKRLHRARFELPASRTIDARMLGVILRGIDSERSGALRS